MYPGPERLDDINAISRLDEAAAGRIFREESGRSIAALVRAFGDIDLAEDAVQEAFAVALRAWARDGLPPNPGGWITTTARNRAIDRRSNRAPPGLRERKRPARDRARAIALVALLGEFARERRAAIDHALELSHAYRGTSLLLELNPRERRDAEFAALLHDVGKIKIKR
jgi:DNA-directed RNA polymerase specialized sigma24 family protein